MSKVLSLAAATISTLVFVACTISVHNFARGGGPIYSVAAEVLLYSVFVVIFVGAWKKYCLEWSKISQRSVLLNLFEKGWFPAGTIFLIAKENIEYSPVAGAIAGSSGLILFLSLVDLDGSIRARVATLSSAVTFNDRKILYSRYPPRTRGDLFPMDVLVHVVVLGMILKKLT